MENLQTTYLGLKLKNPLIAGSCGLTNSISNLKELALKGVGAVVVKSMFEEQIKLETEKVIRTEEGEVKLFTHAPDKLFGKRIQPCTSCPVVTRYLFISRDCSLSVYCPERSFQVSIEILFLLAVKAACLHKVFYNPVFK